MGGNMGTPPAPPQPQQVNFTTTAESRGGFNNFLKSMPNTTNMAPPPPMGLSPPMPKGNPMGNIDIFNQPPSMGMGMMGMNQPQMNPMMQPPMQPPMMNQPITMANQGGIMGTPVQNFYNGGYADDDFGGFSDYGSVDTDNSGVDDFSDSNDTSDPSIGSDSSFNEEDFQAALDNITLGSDDQAFADDPAIVDRRGINVGLENTGGFTTGVVPNLRGERFARFETPAFAQRAIGRDFATKVNRNVLNESGDNALTYGDYFEKFTPTSENPDGTGNRMADFTKATGKGPNDMLSINDMPSIMDIQGKYEAGIRGTPAGQIQQIASTVPMNNDNQIASILDNLDLSKTARTVEPEAYNMFGNPMSTLTNQPGVTVSNNAMQQQVDNSLAQSALDAKDNFSMADPADNVDVFENIIDRNFQNTGLAGANLPNVASTRSTVAQDQAKALANLVGDRDQTIGEKLQQNILEERGSLEERGRALGPTTFSDDLANFSANVRGQTPTEISRVGDDQLAIDAAERAAKGASTVGDDFQTALDLVDARQKELTARDANVRDMDDIDRASAGRASDFPTVSTMPENFEEKVGRDFNADRMADIERLYNRNVGQAGTGVGDRTEANPNALNTGSSKGTDPTFFEGLGVPGIGTTIGDFIERGSRERMANEIAMGRPMGLGETLFGYNAPNLETQTMEDYMSNVQPNYDFGDFNQTSRSIPEKQFIRNDSGRVIGIRDASGRLVSGMDPNAPMNTGDDNDSNPLILRPIAKAKEEEEEEDDGIPNIFGGSTLDPVSSGPVVVDSPFTSNVGDFTPSTFSAGDLNKLIAQLTGVASPKAMAQGGIAGYAGGGLISAVDNFLASV